jgi:RimJ/RimL family protein N-acetyltransferase
MAAAWRAARTALIATNPFPAMQFCLKAALKRLLQIKHYVRCSIHKRLDHTGREAKGAPGATMEKTVLEPLPVGGVIRKLWAAEADDYRQHLLRLDRESRTRRFGGAVSDEVLIRHAATINQFGVVVYGYFLEGVLRGAAELRPEGPLARTAEAAFSIERPWQSLGVGTALLQRVLLTARNRGIKRLQMQCLADNRRMQELARKFAAEFTFDFGSVVGEIGPRGSTPLSLMREWIDDSYGAAEAVLDAQARTLRAGEC